MLIGHDMVRAIRSSVIGKDATIKGPYGARKLVYADYTASGRLLSLVEAYLNVCFFLVVWLHIWQFTIFASSKLRDRVLYLPILVELAGGCLSVLW